MWIFLSPCPQVLGSRVCCYGWHFNGSKLTVSCLRSKHFADQLANPRTGRLDGWLFFLPPSFLSPSFLPPTSLFQTEFYVAKNVLQLLVLLTKLCPPGLVYAMLGMEPRLHGCQASTLPLRHSPVPEKFFSTKCSPPFLSVSVCLSVHV